MVAVLFIAGDQEPAMLFVEVVGNAEILAPEQYGPTCVNVGLVVGFSVIVNVKGVPEQTPDTGVTV